MKLDSKETSRIWWSGTLKGAAKGLLIGGLIGVGCAFALAGLIAASPSFAPVFGGFLSMTGVGGAFTVVPLTIFNGVLGMLANAFNSGNSAVAMYKEERVHQLQESKLAFLENAEAVAHGYVKSYAAEATTPRTTVSVADAQIARLQNAPTSKSLH